MQPHPTLYFDRSLGKALPEALRLLQVPNVLHHHSPPEAAGITRRTGSLSLFADNAPDDEWLEFAGRRGWIAFSQDYKMHRESAPLAAIRQHNTMVFYLWGSQASRWDKMRVFAAAYDRIIAEAANTSGPFVRRVTMAGKLEVVPI
jgi:PIN like domain